MNASQAVLMLVTEPTDRLEEIVEEAIAGGVVIVQLRDKSVGPEELLKSAKRLRTIIGRGALLVVNGDAQIALNSGADGVHLPERGQPVAVAREILGKDRLIGRSVHSVESACAAERDGADYIVAGTIFASMSHPGEPPAGLRFLRAVCDAVTAQVIAIGGITPENARDCLKSGAAGVAVLSTIMQARDPYSVTSNYYEALNSPL